MVRSLLSVRRLPQLAAAGAVCSALLAVAPVPASAGPATDAQGFVDSTARCGTVDATVLYGSTDASRVAICKTGNTFEYRGVRVRDGAKLVAPATASGDGFRAESSGFTYTVTAKSLVVSQGNTTIREETMVDFHRPGTSAPQGAAQGTPVPQNAPTAQNVPQPLESATPSTPLPPPLPAEVGAKR
ncbi:hypothetical protein A5784_01545 [Mycobacterium sp. 852013-50091_SCH5140682]|uniref:hypothetical protein n=1 Tax=Mycobacterium sp. 852013-50091_SCH5140682 TaxID=1834109 RepID=UPI0007E99C81|nr:hypothetical protein [Mycobacterium sp. 852013-50091_SCH5140682]OBC04251.1 hypothetical protein A5784_01545 [Mycobacterium sp. 852013-50091_SCH5140682]